ncbi:putative beta-lysine N-acetyltransferase [Anoxybacillus caldiproteolyticus]|nr:putative beta-lysine N-acetyltransferase [Anoxybacillus caldiproteolyticus]
MNNHVIRDETFVAHVIFDDINERIRVEDYRGDVQRCIRYLKQIDRQKYSKVIVKARQEHVPLFIENGFNYEGWIEGYFRGSHAHFLTFYFQMERKMSRHWCMEDQVLEAVQTKQRTVLSSLPNGYRFRKATVTDANELSNLYRTVFAIYPAPLHDVSYVEKILKEGAMFYVIEHDGTIVSAASAEINRTYYNAELTDCVTLPDHRQHGLIKYLLQQLEADLKHQQIFCAYSLARAQSYGMNAAFHQLGYRYSGRLANNCYIFENLEDMNIWVKDLSQ